MDGHRRSVAKALTWRVIAAFITAIVAWVVTGRAGLGLTIGLGDTIVKLGLYYLHERAWNRVPFGRERASEYQI